MDLFAVFKKLHYYYCNILTHHINMQMISCVNGAKKKKESHAIKSVCAVILDGIYKKGVHSVHKSQLRSILIDDE